MLYPYRPSSVKNRQRFNLACSIHGPTARHRLVRIVEQPDECLVEGSQLTAIEIKVGS